MEHSKASDSVTAGMITNRAGGERVGAGGVFTVTCVGADGKEKWSDTFHNLVVNQGLQDMNSKYFSASGYTSAWYLGLVQGPGSGTTFAAGDTLASHAGWTEVVPYSNATRVAATFVTATTANPSVVTNSASPATFTINATSTVGGAFLTSGSAKSGTTGTLFSAADFAAPGDRSVVSGDILSVTYTFSLSA